MKKVYKKRDEEAVSPVIATILMVAITVVLAAVLYVMVINMGDTGTIETPLGLTQQSKTTTSVNILIADTPTDARIASTSISLTHDGNPTPVTNVTVFSAAAVEIAWYNGVSWTYGAGLTADTAEFASGQTVKITAAAVSSGDSIVFSSADGYFGTTTFSVS